jgi:hypothetical protein
MVFVDVLAAEAHIKDFHRLSQIQTEDIHIVNDQQQPQSSEARIITGAISKDLII